jgi:hypothetical protein
MSKFDQNTSSTTSNVDFKLPDLTQEQVYSGTNYPLDDPNIGSPNSTSPFWAFAQPDGQTIILPNGQFPNSLGAELSNNNNFSNNYNPSFPGVNQVGNNLVNAGGVSGGSSIDNINYEAPVDNNLLVDDIIYKSFDNKTILIPIVAVALYYLYGR